MTVEYVANIPDQTDPLWTVYTCYVYMLINNFTITPIITSNRIENLARKLFYVWQEYGGTVSDVILLLIAKHLYNINK